MSDPTAEPPDAFELLQKKSLRDTRRHTFAGLLLQSLIGHAGANATDATLVQLSQTAVRAADVLLRELDKPTR